MNSSFHSYGKADLPAPCQLVRLAVGPLAIDTGQLTARVRGDPGVDAPLDSRRRLIRAAVMGFLLNERRVDINSTPACPRFAPLIASVLRGGRPFAHAPQADALLMARPCRCTAPLMV